MVLRWTAAGVLEAERGFRKLVGYRAMPILVAALRAQLSGFLRNVKLGFGLQLTMSPLLNSNSAPDIVSTTASTT
jgi:hypothetical protein